MRLFSGSNPPWQAKLGLMAAAFGWAGTASAQAPGLDQLKKSYEEEVSKTVLPLREGYRKALLTLEGQLAAKGDYAGARRVQDERRAMERVLGKEISSEGTSAGNAGAGGIVTLGKPAECGGGVSESQGTWTGWRAAGGFIRWALPAGLRGGGYALELVYSSSAEGGLSLAVREDFHTLNRMAKAPAAPSAGAPEGRLKLGTLRLRPGASMLELKLTAPSTVGDFRLFELRLIPEEAAP